MGLPEIFISFETAAVTAITRSARGVLAVVLADDTAGGEAVYRTLAEVPKDAFTAENYRLLELAFLAAPSKVIVLRAGADESAVWEAAQEKLRQNKPDDPVWNTCNGISYYFYYSAT